MSGNISLTSEVWHGTQMKPDMYEPATSEWAVRAAQNAGWLFERQQQVIFGEGLERWYQIETPAMTYEQLFRRRFWLNEVFGMFYFRFYFELLGAESYVAATMSYGWDHTAWAPIGTADATYSSSGWKTLTVYAYRIGWKSNLNQYGQFTVNVANKLEEDTTNLRYCSLSALPRT